MKCYLCASQRTEQIHDRIRFGYNFKPYRCRDCGLVFLHPYFTSSELDEFYRHEYRALLGNEVTNELFNRCLPEAQIRVERFRNVLTATESILEIGCSTGHFLQVASNIVPNVFGVELGESTAHYARSLRLDIRQHVGEFKPESFDAIFAFHVLEHVPDPICFLQEIQPFLKRKGKLIIEVPNVEDILVSVYEIRDFMDIYFSAPHKFYFSRDTLTRVINEAGFRCEIYPLQRYDLSNHIFWLLYGKPGGLGHFKNIFSDKLDNEYANCLKENFLCDTIYAIAQRAE